MFCVNAYVQIWVRVAIEGPRVDLDDALALHSEEEVTVVASLAPEEYWLLIVKLEWLSDLLN